MTQGRFDPREARPTLHPRKVRGGLRLASREGPVSPAWAAQRWMRLVEDHAAGDALREGLVYARAGQTRSLDVRAGAIAARVQGRMPQAYGVSVRLPVFSHDQWAQVVDAMLAQARYAASLLAGEMPPGIEDLFGPMRLRLFPREPSDLALSCTCGLPGPWCKHVVCVMALVAERLGQDPFLVFLLRGIERDDFFERLRQRRASLAPGRAGGLDRPAPVYAPHLSGISDGAVDDLVARAADFWTAGPGLDELDLPVGPPEVSHPLLRRLGPSPIQGARFPLVGLLATCYDIISRDAIAREEGFDSRAGDDGQRPTEDDAGAEPDATFERGDAPGSHGDGGGSRAGDAA